MRQEQRSKTCLRRGVTTQEFSGTGWLSRVGSKIRRWVDESAINAKFNSTTLLEMMRSAMGEPEYPGGLYLALTLHYVEQEHRAQSAADARPRNETVEQICAYLAANYQQKLSLTEVAARFYISPFYLSRLFRRVTGQSIVDYINARRIEAAQKLLETTELSIGSVAEQTGFASAAHFRRVFRETMGVGPLQYRKSRK